MMIKTTDMMINTDELNTNMMIKNAKVVELDISMATGILNT